MRQLQHLRSICQDRAWRLTQADTLQTLAERRQSLAGAFHNLTASSSIRLGEVKRVHALVVVVVFENQRFALLNQCANIRAFEHFGRCGLGL